MFEKTVDRLIRLYNRLFRTKTLKVSQSELETLLRENKDAPTRKLELGDTEQPSTYPITALSSNPTGPNGRGINPGIVQEGIGGYGTDAINQRFADAAFEEKHRNDNN
ncbi:MAG: hypothetical protein RL149_636 [Actinomycetota bacterium]|jgi:hypothetical protein